MDSQLENAESVNNIHILIYGPIFNDIVKMSSF